MTAGRAAGYRCWLQLPMIRRRPALFLILGLAAVGMAASEEVSKPAAPEEHEALAEPFALVELFTSEGCSSFPPADQFLGDLVRLTQKSHQRIFPLAFHVDYWNRLGWADPFSDPSYTRRQHLYARALNTDEIYTPQMIVNGAEAFVGSDRRKAHEQIGLALRETAHAAVRLKSVGWKGTGRLLVEYEVQGAPLGAKLQVALVERGLASYVPRGENAGLTLAHENVVRAFETVSLSQAGSGQVELHPPSSVKVEDASLIGYVQNPVSMAVLGAVAVDLFGQGEAAS